MSLHTDSGTLAHVSVRQVEQTLTCSVAPGGNTGQPTTGSGLTSQPMGCTSPALVVTLTDIAISTDGAGVQVGR